MSQSAKADTKFTPKREKFRQLAEKRTDRALESVRRIGNLSNTQLYEWDDAEIKKILKALKDAVSEVEERFSTPKGKKAGKFRL